MHASLVSNYQPQPLQQQQQRQQHQDHYYDYPAPDVVSVHALQDDAACLAVGLLRPSGDPLDRHSLEGSPTRGTRNNNNNNSADDDEMPPAHSMPVPTISNLQQVLVEEQRASAQISQHEETVHFLGGAQREGNDVASSFTETAQSSVPPQEHPTQEEDYRYPNQSVSYHQHHPAHEPDHYYQPPSTASFIVGNEQQSTAFHQHHAQRQASFQEVAATSGQQAVDLSFDQQQHSAGPFESNSHIYYDLSASTSLANHGTLNYNQTAELQANFYTEQQPTSHYQSSASLDVRHSVEFVSVLTEQNRFLQPDSLDPTQTSVQLQQQQQQQQLHYLYEQQHQPPLARTLTEDNIQQFGSQANSSEYGIAFGNQKLHPQHLHAQPPSERLDESLYCHPLGLAATDYQEHAQGQPGCPLGDSSRQNNENHYHQLVDHDQQQQQLQLQLHRPDCAQNVDKQQQRAAADYGLDAATHEAMSSLGCATNASTDARETHSCAPSTISEESSSSSMTSNSDLESVDSALTRDEKRAREANIPLSYHEIVNLSIDQFNDHISRFPYSETQLTLMKDIRRRGKNKVAAQTCRKRKMEQITELQQEVSELANKRVMLTLERSKLVQEHARLVGEYDRWCSLIRGHLQIDRRDFTGGTLHEKLIWTTPTGGSSAKSSIRASEDDGGQQQQQVPLC